MTQANSKSDGIKRVKGRLAMFALISLAIIGILAYLLLTVVTPLLESDGTASYSGAQKQAATRALGNVKDHLEIDHKILSRVHVDKVYATTLDEKSKYCAGGGAIESSGPTQLTIQ